MIREIIKFIYLRYWGVNLRAYTLSHSTSLFFCDGFFPDRILRTIFLGWLQTMILLVSPF
jgi:hypothetical protein